MNPPPPLPWEKRRTPRALAVVTSLAYPGAGQFVLGKKASGIILCSLTTTVAAWWLIALVRGIAEFVRAMPNGKMSLVLIPLIEPTWAIGACYAIGVVAALISGRATQKDKP